MLMYTGIGAASVVVPLALIGLFLLIMTRFRTKGEVYCDGAVPYTHVVCV